MKYIDAEKLIAEIEKYENTAIDAYNPLGEDADFWHGKVVASEDIKSIITSLQQEQINVDLEEVAEHLSTIFAGEGSVDPKREGFAFYIGFKNGAKWKEEQMMKEAIDAQRTGVEVNDWKRKIVFSFALPDKDYEKMNKVKVIIIKSE